MRVVLSTALLGDEKDGPLALALLLLCAGDWPHLIPLDETSGPTFAEYLATQPAARAQVLAEAEDLWLLDAARTSLPDDTPALRVGPQETGFLNLDRQSADPHTAPLRLAFDLLRRPTQMHVEDEINDRAFLLAIAPPALRAELERREAAGWLEWKGGGKSTLLRRLRALDAEGWTESGFAQRGRAFCFFDKDDESRKQTRDDNEALLRHCAQELVAGAWITERHKIEAYAPPVARNRMERRPKNKEKLRAEDLDGITHHDFDPDAQAEARRAFLHLRRAL